MRVPVVLALLLLAAPLQAAVDPSTFNSLAFRQHPGAQLPLQARIADASGRPVPLASALGGRPAVVILEYLRCKNLCSLVLSGAVQAMVAAGLTPGRDVNLVAISIDPRDTPADAAAAQAMYSRRFPNPAAAAGGVRFFTGAPAQVHAIAAAIGFPYRFDRQSGQFLHPAGFVVTTPTGKVSRYVLGLNPQPALLKKAVAEAGRDEVEPAAHPLLCLCFGALTWQLVRSASIALVLGCAGLIFMLALRRRTAR
jgi:protein SCO1/2